MARTKNKMGLRRKLLANELIKAGEVTFKVDKPCPVTVEAPENVPITHCDPSGKPKKGKK